MCVPYSGRTKEKWKYPHVCGLSYTKQTHYPHQYTVPKIKDALACLNGSKWLDLRSGYYQVPTGESDKEKTAFICTLGFY